MNAYVVTIATLITINAIVVCGLNVIVGYAGQISLGHAAFFGIGAYSAAMLATKAGLSFWAALPLVIAISAFIGLLLGLPSLRVREDFPGYYHHRHQFYRGSGISLYPVFRRSAGNRRHSPDCALRHQA